MLGDLSDSTLADQLAKYLPTVPTVAAQQNVDEEGYADFTKLPQGLYLVMQTEASHGYEAIKPFLVSIPLPGWRQLDLRCGRHPQGRRYHPGYAGDPAGHPRNAPRHP